MVFVQFNKATLSIDTFGISKPDPIKNLRVDEARLARRYILALVECKKSKIDISGMELDELKAKLKNIGIVQYTTEEKGYHNL
jgi:hypothetical protein